MNGADWTFREASMVVAVFAHVERRGDGGIALRVRYFDERVREGAELERVAGTLVECIEEIGHAIRCGDHVPRRPLTADEVTTVLLRAVQRHQHRLDAVLRQG